MWFGGIGTYIKSSEETHIQVGDGANNSVRIDASECRAKVIGEGANLGVTQPSRIELAAKGIRLNTDAIDNSAGVNMSDYEVNLKILLKSMVDKKIVTQAKQRSLLEAATDEVTELVLANNRAQHIQLSLDTLRSKRNLPVFAQLIQDLIEKEILDGKSWSIPSPAKMDELDADNLPLQRSVLSIVQAHVKMIVFDALQVSDLVKEAFFEPMYQSYFPKSLLKVFTKQIDTHPLKYEIISMLVTNQLVNQTGSTFLYQLQEHTGFDLVRLIKTYICADVILDGAAFRATIEKESVSQEDRYRALLLLEDILMFVTKDILQFTHRADIKFSDLKNYISISKTLRLKTAKSIEEASKSWVKMGYSAEMATDIAALPVYESLPELIFLHEAEKLPIDLSAQLLFQTEDVFGFKWMEHTIRHISSESYLENEQKNLLLEQLFDTKLAIIRLLCKTHKNEALSKSHIKDLIESLGTPYQNAIHKYFDLYAELKSGIAKSDLTSFSVCLNRLRVFES